MCPYGAVVLFLLRNDDQLFRPHFGYLEFNAVALMGPAVFSHTGVLRDVSDLRHLLFPLT
jgi:hypothetical protein